MRLRQTFTARTSGRLSADAWSVLSDARIQRVGRVAAGTLGPEPVLAVLLWLRHDQHKVPLHLTPLTKWRQRVGPDKLVMLL